MYQILSQNGQNTKHINSELIKFNEILTLCDYYEDGYTTLKMHITSLEFSY